MSFDRPLFHVDPLVRILFQIFFQLLRSEVGANLAKELAAVHGEKIKDAVLHLFVFRKRFDFFFCQMFHASFPFMPLFTVHGI